MCTLVLQRDELMKLKMNERKGKENGERIEREREREKEYS